MGAVSYRARSELRVRWRPRLALAVLVGAFAGLATAAAAGAQRTDTVVARSLRTFLSPEIFAVPAFTQNGDLLRFDTIRAFPEVATAFRSPMFFDAEDVDVGAFPSDQFGVVTSGSKLLAGRLPHPDDPEEVVMNFLAAERLHLKLGRTLTLHLAGPNWFPDGTSDPPPGPTVRLRVVGTVTALGDFASVASPGLTATPAFLERYAPLTSHIDLFMFDLRRGDADLQAFREHMRQLTGGKGVFYVESRNDVLQVQRSFHLQALALWILAGFMAIVAAAVFGEAFVRQTWLESREYDRLESLGMSPRQRAALHAVRAFGLAVVAAAVCTGAAYLLSGLAPLGRARIAEPSPGASFAVRPILAGDAVLVLVVMASSVIPALVSVRTRSFGASSRIAEVVRRALPGAAPGVGVGFALEQTEGGVPVRSTIAGCALGALAVVVSLTVAGSLTHMLATPRVYGWNWDVMADVGSAHSVAAQKIQGLRGVTDVTFGSSGGAQVDLGNITAELMTLGPGKVQPVLLQGRLPSAPTEIAVGGKTLREARVHIGDVVSIGIQGETRRCACRIVGIVVIPFDSDTSTLGEGVFMTNDGLSVLIPSVAPDVAFVTLAPGAAGKSALAQIRSIVGSQGTQTPSRPVTIVDFGHVRSMPLVAAGLVALLGIAAMAHLQVSSVRRRRKDLAVLKTLGFSRRQVLAAFAWQTSTIALIGLLVGVPVGIALGRWTWKTFADFGGFAPEPVVSTVSVLAVVAGALVLANIIALAPGRSAARTRPASVLRAE